MAWHTGYTLSQTVFSFLYVHALPDIDPDTISPHHHDPDRARPVELVSVVLRASVLGLLKCCDLVWRELIKGNVYDCEDWQSDKCDVPMSGAYPVSRILGILNEACVWVRNSSRVRSMWRTALTHRLVFRKTLVELFSALLSKDYFRFQPLIKTACVMLQHVALPLRLLHDHPLPHHVRLIRSFHEFLSLRFLSSQYNYPSKVSLSQINLWLTSGLRSSYI
ncbi:Mak10 subunit, NatC N-terminal acetyltransferase-domain-containing protein [Pisolithus croceorrhizus]|nr:Mak10 subunit, NatC N-terminal acetyltransferase-domain-containing protein [Pisolithus croceorrhizus]